MTGCGPRHRWSTYPKPCTGYVEPLRCVRPKSSFSALAIDLQYPQHSVDSGRITDRRCCCRSPLRPRAFRRRPLFVLGVRDVRRYSVITDRCTQDLNCAAVCLQDAIHPTAADEAAFAKSKQLFIDPRRCIGCGACILACVHEAIFATGELPEPLHRFAGINAEHYAH